MSDPHWLPLNVVEAAIPAMERLHVSRVARGEAPSRQTQVGFVEAYRYAEGSPEIMHRLPARPGESWADRRAAFVRRHVAQAEANGEPWFRGGRPTRRLLGLVAWAFVPDEAAEELGAWLDAGAPTGAKRNAPDAAARAKRRADLLVRTIPPVDADLIDAFNALVLNGSAKPAQVLQEHIAAAVPDLALNGLLSIVRTEAQHGIFGGDWPVYTVKVTPTGKSAADRVKRAQAALRALDAEEEERAAPPPQGAQISLFGARSNPASGSVAPVIGVALDPERMSAAEIRRVTAEAHRVGFTEPRQALGFTYLLDPRTPIRSLDRATLRADDSGAGWSYLLGLTRE